MLKLFNTLTRDKDEFRPIGKNVRLYTCGPTVYNFAHIGNFRAYVCSDILKRYLLFKGFEVLHVMNITDVDDKTIRDSRKEGVTLMEFTERYTKAFMDDLHTLNILPADVFPKATGHIDEMVKLIIRLLDKGIAYEGEDGSIYFDISRYIELGGDYGKLSKIKLDELKAGARVSQDEYEKESVADFALWKAWDAADGDVFWETKIGKGRPGWHIECSAMSMKYLGESFDIHTGGVDLVFPHHENEIAQSEGATEKPFVKYWLHNEYILVDNKKMSKSLGNFYTLRDLLRKGYDARAIRYLLFSAHYRQQLNFTLEGIDAATNSVARLSDFMRKLDSAIGAGVNPDVKALIGKAALEFEAAMDDDLNISAALAKIFEFVRDINKVDVYCADAQDVKAFMARIDSVLGILSEEKAELSDEDKALIEKRQEARAKRNWAESDRLRDELKDRGIIVEDTKGGMSWKRA